MTPPRLPLVKAQQSFLSGIRLSGEQHGPKVKVTAPPIKKRKFRTLWVLPFDFLASYRVSKYKIPREIRRNNKLKKMDSNQEKALKMAFIIHCMYKSKMFSFHFKSSRSFNDV